jgi:hypothetical protein
VFGNEETGNQIVDELLNEMNGEASTTPIQQPMLTPTTVRVL